MAKKPKHLGNFQIWKLIGKSRMGEVYLAIQEPLSREVALKVITDNPLAGTQLVERFYREIRALAKLEHPHVIPIYAAGNEGDYYYIAMRYAHDGNLEDRLAGGEAISLKRALTWMRQVIWAVSAAHEQGIVHRDIKPNNILLDGGIAFLTDFGLAFLDDMYRITETDQTLGTPLYMAPEQLEGAEPMPVRDVYSLGVMLYLVLTQQHPFIKDIREELPVGKAIAMIQAAAQKGDFARPGELNRGVPPSLDNLVLRCLDLEPDARYQDAGELLVELDKVMAQIEMESAG
jgi:eukaryotic-like serine/threonine-protein kinase